VLEIAKTTAAREPSFDPGWVEPQRNPRGLVITPAGKNGLLEFFGLSI
jgi:hypothetical protein